MQNQILAWKNLPRRENLIFHFTAAFTLGCQMVCLRTSSDFCFVVKIRFSLGKPASQSTVPAPPPASCALPTTWLPGRPAEEEEEEEEEEEQEG